MRANSWSPAGNGRAAAPAREASQPRSVASMTTLAFTAWRPDLLAITAPAGRPDESRRMSVAAQPVRYGMSASRSARSRDVFTRSGVV